MFVFISGSLFSQDSVKVNLLPNNFYTEYKVAPKRKVLSLKNKGFISKINPVTYVSAGLLFIYQSILSEQIQAECIYQISCSGYTKFQIEQNGFRGFLLGFHQLNNCVASAPDDYPACMITSENKIINPVSKIGK